MIGRPALTFFILQYVTSVVSWKSRVYGGESLRHAQHKYLVRLDVFKIQLLSTGLFEKVGLCSGSIISNSWIVSANHCFPASTASVRVLHFNPEDKDMDVIADVQSRKIFRYPEYNLFDHTPNNIEKDLALLKTSKLIIFSDYIQPIALSNRTPYSYDKGIMAGYGTTELVSSLPSEGTVDIRKYIFGSKLLCSLSTVRASDGDSGGALLSREVLVGVISASCIDVLKHKTCLTVYVDVASNIEWIRHILADN